MADVAVMRSVQTSSLQRRAGVDYADVQQLFRSLRKVFSPDRQRERAVFWVEEKYGQAVVRHVRTLARTRKAEDYLIGSTVCDIAAIRILIGNFAAGCNMTTVRWELYGDFGLTERLSYGRFDRSDLLGEDAEQHVRHGIAPIGNWDFDSLILMHQCPACGGVFVRNSIVYVPWWRCETCDQELNPAQSSDVIWKLVRQFLDRQQRLTTHAATGRRGSFPVQYCLDPLANSVVYYAITSGTQNPLEKREEYRQALEAIFPQSLFWLMRSREFRRRFHRYIRRRDPRDWELFLGAMGRTGEMLLTPLVQLKELELFRPFVEVALPLFLNSTISHYGMVQIRRKKHAG